MSEHENLVELPSPAQREAIAKSDADRKRISEVILAQADGWRNEVRRWLADTDPSLAANGIHSEHLRDPVARVIKKYMSPGAKPEIVSTGFPDLDEMMSLEPQSLVIVGARSSRGKSCISLQFAMNVATTGNRASLYFTTEMSSEQLALRGMCTIAGVDSKRVRRNTYTPDEYGRLGDACNQIGRSLAWITDENGLDVMRVKQRARTEVKRIEQECGRAVKLIVVDYLQRIKPGKVAPHGANREQQIGAIAQELKELARELDLCVVVPAQLNADGDKRGDEARPRPGDVRESKNIENEADIVLLIHNPHYIEREADKSRDLSMGEACELILGKGRSDGTGSVPVWFTPLYTRFSSMTEADKAELRFKAELEKKGAKRR
jgi:replicative DNA helicase